MQERNGAEIILDHLIGQKVPHLIGLCGHGDVGLMDAAYNRQNEISMISVHNEQTAGYMADAYYRVSKQPLATFTSVGPGSISIQVAIANALFDLVGRVCNHRQHTDATIQPWPVSGNRISLSS